MEIVLAEQIDELNTGAETGAAIKPDAGSEIVRGVPDTSVHITLLVLSSAVIFLSVVLRVEGERQVVVPLINLPLPEVCSSQRFFGMDCLGCGLTRSFISIGHGDLLGAWHFNPAGLLGFGIVAMQVPYRVGQWIRIRRGRPEFPLKDLGQFLLGTFATILLVQWLVRLGW